MNKKCRKKLLRHFLNTTACIVVAIGFSCKGIAAPEGALIVGGAALVSQSGPETTINQSTDRAIIRWNSFDVGQTEKVRFQQPSSTSITVNRINDTKASRIDGEISANGQIVMLNPNGIVFGATSKVDVASLVATSSDFENDAEFISGGLARFNQSGSPEAKIINQGQITVKEAGLVGFVAPHIENNGLIQARLGKVQLASGDIHTLDMAGDGLIQIAVSDKVVSQSVRNTGKIEADGGDIILTAAQGRSAIDALISNHGVLQANQIVTNGRKGQIRIIAPVTRQNKTKVIEGGTLIAEGGKIEITADRVVIEKTANISVASQRNGGDISIGGYIQGTGNLPTAQYLTVEKGAILNASSHVDGHGGNIILWSDKHTIFQGDIFSKGGNNSGDGGFVEVSGKDKLTYQGYVDLRAIKGKTGTLLLDPTDITISSALDLNVTGTSPFFPTLDNGPSILNVTTLTTALASASVIVQTRATGVQAGNITIDAPISWVSGNTLTLDAHNNIVINQSISGQNLTLIAGGDVQANAALSGTGTLTIQQANNSGTIGVGASAVGTLNLSAADLGNINNGWADIIIGKFTSTGAMDIRAASWNDNLTLKSDTGVITFTGITNVGSNNLTINTNADIVMTAGNLTGSGILAVSQTSAATTLGLAGGAGTVNLSAAEILRITNGWASLVFGRKDGTGLLTTGVATWNDNLTLQTGTGVITISGAQALGTNNLTLNTDADIALNVANALGGSGNIAFYNNTDSTTFGLAGGAGTINLTATEIGRIVNGWANITFGRTDGTGDINIGAVTWNDNLTVQTGSGIINISGVQTMGANNITYLTDSNIVIGAALTSTGILNIAQSSVGTSLALGNTQTGILNLNDAEIANITNGWASLVFGRTDGTADVNVGALTWNDNLTLQSGSGIININGAQAMTANNVTIRTDSNVNIGSSITSTGTFSLVQSSANTSLGVLDGQAGTVHLSNAENILLGSTWASRVFGRIDGTADLNVGGATWVDPMTFRTGSGALNLNGAQAMGVNALTLSANGDILIGGNLSGTTTFTIVQSGASTIGLGSGQTGAVAIDDTERNRIVNGWASLVFGSTTSTGGINVGTASWSDILTLRSGTGVVAINGGQTMAGNNLAITTDSNLAINAALTGTGTLSISGMAVATTVGIGDSETGTVHLSNAEIARITDGWGTLAFGTTTQTGNLNIGGVSFNDNTLLRTSTGIISVNGAINMNANALSFSADSNTNIAANLIGTGTLSMFGTGNATTVGVGTGQTGTFQLTNAELAFIQDGWATLIFGKTSMTGILNIGARTWLDSVDLRTNSGALNINGVQTMGSSNLSIRTNTNLTLANNLIGTGTLSIFGTTTTTTMGIGTGQTGTLQLVDTELAFIQDGWTQIIFGNTANSGIINIGARTWTDSVDFRTTGAINVNGIQTMGANNLTFRSNTDPVISAVLNGTGALSFMTITTTATMAVGSGAGTVSISDAELNLITDGWSSIYFGNTAQTGAMSVSARTWNDSVTFNTSTGVISINGVQTMGANNLTINTAGNVVVGAALTGTGTLSILGNATNTTMGIGTSAAGTVSLDNTELGRITDGWGNIIFGRDDSSGAIAVNAYTWTDNVTFQTGSGVITVAGAQASGANNMTFIINGDLALNANLSGTGILTIRTASGITAIGVGTAQTGGLSLSATDISRFANGWNNITIGGTTQLGAINIGANTWNDKMTFVSQGNIVLNGVQGTTETAGNTLVFATTAGTFTNNAGSSAINPNTGRYLVYSVNESNDTLGGLIPITIVNPATFAAYGPSLVTETGNVFLYSGAVAKIIFIQIDNLNKIYGDNLPTFTYTYLAGLQNGDTLVSVIASTSYNVTGNSIFDNTGTTRTITGVFAGNLGYTITVLNATLTVVKATLTVTAENDTREYGDANPTLSSFYSGFKNGDDETDIDTLGTASSIATLTSNVGNYDTVSSGDIDNNYNFSYVNGTLTITKANLVATANNQTREYGDANPAFTTIYTGFKNSETSAVIDTLATASTTAIASTNAGTAVITASGANDNNYNFSYVNGTLTITKATVTATAQNDTREYGDANPVFTTIYTGFKNSETSGVIDTLAIASTTANAFTTPSSQTITLSGGLDNNYNLILVNGTLTVTKANLSITADNRTREYGDANPVLTYTFGTFKNSQTLSVLGILPTISTLANATTNAGTQVITLSGGSDTNYNYVFTNGTLTIDKAPLVLQIGNGTRIEGDPNPIFTYIISSGLKNGDLPTVLTGVTLSTPANTFTPLGTYAINGLGGVATNYFVSSYLPGILTITSGVLPKSPVTNLPSSVYYSHSLAGKKNWDSWREIIYFQEEDDDYKEKILIGREVVSRKYSF